MSETWNKTLGPVGTVGLAMAVIPTILQLNFNSLRPIALLCGLGAIGCGIVAARKASEVAAADRIKVYGVAALLVLVGVAWLVTGGIGVALGA